MPLFSNRHAFVISVQEYQNGIRSLATPIADAGSIAKVLRENFGFEIHTCTLNPTQAELTAFLESIPTLVGDVDETETQVFIYFAGHGVALDSSTGVKGYLLPSDARQTTNGQNTLADTSVSMDFWVEAIQGLKAQQLLLVLDCCFAGLIRWASLSTHRGLELGEDQELYRQQFYFNTRHKVRQVLTSSSHDQQAIDLLGVRDDTNQNSPFARLLVQALNGEADSNKDDVLMLEEIQTYVNGRLAVVTQQQNNEQITGFYPLADHDCGSFLLFAKDFDSGTLDPKVVTNPFKGLQAYDVQDRAIYTGRQTVIEAITALIKKQSSTNKGVIVVSGISGSGKSSVVRAGVIPRLPNFSSIPVVVPGRTPLAVLADLECSSSTIVVVDQLEQIITQATDTNELAVDTFMQKLISLNKTVICTVRTDFEVQIFKHKDLSKEPFSLYRMPRLEREDIRDIILKPAMRVGRFFYPESLVETIVDDFQNYPNSLSLLSLVLYELFEQCKQDVYHEITPDNYRDIGGLTGVLNRKLETLYAEFASPDEQRMLQNILLRMTSVKGGKLTARRVYWRELVFEEPAKQTLCGQIVEALASDKYRLIVVDKGNYVEPSHDVVVQSWGTQPEWVAEINSGRLGLREALSIAIEDYNQQPIETSYLWNNDPNLLLLGERPKAFWPQLQWDWQSFKRTFYQQREWFTKPEAEFVRKSFNLRKLVRARNRGLTTGIGFALIGVIYLIFQQLTITRQNLLVTQLIALAEKTDDKTLAVQAAYKAWKIAPYNPQVAFLLSKNLREKHYLKNLQNNNKVESVCFSPDDKYILLGCTDSTLKVWDWKHEKLIKTLKFPNKSERIICFSTDKKYIILKSEGPVIRIWDWQKNSVKNLKGHSLAITSAAFSKDQRYIVSLSLDNTMKIWDWSRKGLLVGNFPIQGTIYINPS